MRTLVKYAGVGHIELVVCLVSEENESGKFITL